MPVKDSEKLKKRKAKIKAATKLTANIVIGDLGRGFNMSLQLLNQNIEENKNKKLDEKTISDLVSSYSACIGEASSYLKNEDLPREVIESVEKVKRSLAKDLRVLKNYEKRLKNATEEAPVEDCTFNQLLEVSRSKRLSVDVNNVDKAGAGQHVRAVIPTDDGKLYFTETEKTTSSQVGLQKLYDSYKKKYGQDANFLEEKGIRFAVSAIYRTRAFRRDDAAPGLKSPEEIFDVYKKVIEDDIKKREEANKGLPEEKQRKIPYKKNVLDPIYNLNSAVKKKILFSFINDYAKMSTALSINLGEGIHEGCYQDKRNSATTYMAEELGLGDIVAHSENVHISFTDGGTKRTVKGTAMKAAKGEDFNIAGVDSNLMKMTKQSLENPGLIKQVAGMQVLDYLCGNSDRHGFNFSYIVDENGNLIGIQGYDNDSSFGSRYETSGYKGKCVKVEDFGIIPESVANKVMEMDAQTLTYTLHGFDLNAEEIEAARKRLETLKETIKLSREHYAKKNYPEGKLDEGIPRIVKDDNIGEYSFTRDLSINRVPTGKKGEVYGNLFGLITRMVSGGRPIKEIDLTLSSVIQKNAAHLTGDNWVNSAEIINNMKIQNPRRALGSAQYDRMLEETERLQRMLRDFEGPVFEKKLDEATQKYTIEFTEDAKKIKEKIDRVDQLTDTYLNERAFRRRANLKSKTSRAYKRYALAMKNKNMMLELKKSFSTIEETYNAQMELGAKKAALIAEAVSKDKKLDKEMDKKIQDRENKFQAEKKKEIVMKK